MREDRARAVAVAFNADAAGCYESTQSRESVTILAIWATSDSLIRGCDGTRLVPRIRGQYRVLSMIARLPRDMTCLIPGEYGLYSRESSVRIILAKLPKLS